MKNYQLSILIFLLLTSSTAFSQNTNLGANAGNGGVSNTSIGYFAADVVIGNGNTAIGAYSGRVLSNGNYNSFLGFTAGYSNTTGSNNLFAGAQAGYGNLTGSNNTYLGNFSGQLSTSSFSNSFLGTYSGFNNTSGYENTFAGFQSGYSNSLGQQNSFFGALAGKQNTTASNNSYFGFGAGYTNSTGNKNAFFGSESGFYTTSSYNTLLGYRAGYSNTTGSSNTYVGSESGYFNTTGGGNSFFGSESGKNNSSGNNNTFLGAQAGVLNTSAINNTFVGSLSGSQNTTGTSNTLVGSHSGLSLTTGQSNVMLGVQAGNNNNGSNNVFIGLASGGQNTGSGNVFIGNQSGYYSDKNSNKLIIHNTGDSFAPLIYGDFQNRQLGIGTSSLGNYTLSVNGDAFASGLWLSSDKRFKQDEKVINDALEKIGNVKGVSYQFKGGEHANTRSFSEGTQLGFIAQDLRKTFPELVKENSDGYLAVNYVGMIPVLVEAIKELKIEIQKLESELSQTTESNHFSIKSSKVFLEQNHPNPFDKSTTIRYNIPEDVSHAAIYIFDLNGKQLMVFDNLKLGNSEITVSLSHLSPGLYHYSLVVDGKIVDTKKMLLTEK